MGYFDEDEDEDTPSALGLRKLRRFALPDPNVSAIQGEPTDDLTQQVEQPELSMSDVASTMPQGDEHLLALQHERDALEPRGGVRGFLGDALGRIGDAVSGSSNFRNEQAGRQKRSDTLLSQIGQEQGRMTTTAAAAAKSEAAGAETRRFHDIQAKHYQAEDDARGHEATPEQQAYDYLVSQGMHPDEAFERVKNAKETQPKAFNIEAEYYDALSKGDTKRAQMLKDTAAAIHPPSPGTNILVPNLSGGVAGTFNTKTRAFELPPAGLTEAGGRKTAAPSPVATRVIQAGAIAQSQRALEAQIDKNTGNLGPWSGRWTNIHQFLGDANPEAAKLKAMLTAHFSLIPAMHGMRANAMVQDMDRKYGNLKFTPQSLKAMIEGISGASQFIKSSIADYYGEQQGQGQGEGAPQVDYEYDPQKGLVPASPR